MSDNVVDGHICLFMGLVKLMPVQVAALLGCRHGFQHQPEHVDR